jgi:hypothetical protein
MPYTDPVAKVAAHRAHYLKNREKYLAAAKLQRQTQKEQIAVWSRESMLRTRYGMTIADYDRMLREQGGVCAICGTDRPQGQQRKTHLRRRRIQFFSVDHSHKTGIVRGLLCHSCNVLVAYAEHERLAAAQAYLRRADQSVSPTVQ